VTAGPAARGGTGGPTPRRTSPRQLPRAIEDFTGRVQTVRLVATLLAGTDSRAVVSVTGSAGTGKTTLAVRAGHLTADRFPDGQLYVSLDGGSARPRHPEQVLAGVLNALGVPDGAIPAGLSARVAAYRARLAGTRVLVLLDDATDVAQLSPLLPETDGCAVLVTSRHRLAELPVTGSTELGALSRGDALALLARVIGPDRAAAESAAAADLVELCGRLPIAIRVVAARLVTRPSWTLGSLLVRLRDQRRLLDELTVDDLDVRVGFEVSYAALSPADQVVFRRFALAGVSELPGWAVVALSGLPGTDGSVDRLVDSHLLEPVVGTVGRRYRMHDLARLFAAETSARSDGAIETADGGPGPARVALRRLFDTTRSLIGVAYDGLPTPADWLSPLGPRPPAWSTDVAGTGVLDDPMAWCGQEVQVLQAVLTRAVAAGWHREVLDSVERLAGFLAMQSRMSETDRLYSALVDAVGVDDLVLARATYGLAEARMMAGRLTEAAELFGRAVSAFTRIREPAGLAHGLVFLSFCHVHRGDLDEADSLAERGLAVARESGDPRCETRALRQLGRVRIGQERLTEAVDLLDRALLLTDDIDSADLEGIVLNSLANALVESADLDRADAVCLRAAALLERLAQPVARAYIGVTQARIAELRGSHLAAIALLEDARKVFRQLGDRRGEAGADHRLGVNELALGRAARAVPLLRCAVSAFRDLELTASMERAQEALMSAARAQSAD
jgi:tetratricopeptide (TPR) repeat protein